MKDIYYYLLVLSTILVAALFIAIASMKNKKQIHYAFLSLSGFLFIWCLTNILQIHIGYDNMALVFLGYVGICLVPVSMLFLGIIFAYTKVKFTYAHFLLLIIPILTLLIVFTNKYHHLFYVEYSSNPAETIFGPYAIVHFVYSFSIIFIGLIYFIFFSVKNSGFFSKQSMLIIIGCIFPITANFLYTFKIIKLSPLITPISFSLFALCIAIAIMKFKFLNVMPIALQRVVDLISDGYVVINEDNEVIDFNKTFTDTFKDYLETKRKGKFFNILSSKTSLIFNMDSIIDSCENSIKKKETVSFEEHVTGDDFDKYFKVEVTPIFSKFQHLGTIVLFKDITQAKRDIEVIREKQSIILGQERLASLGQLIGGIAHNLRTPIMSLAGGIEGLRDLVDEYKESLNDAKVTKNDHLEIINDMNSWLDRMKPHCSYMSDLITAVKGQARVFDSRLVYSFTLDELLKRIDILMNHELKQYRCDLEVQNEIDNTTEIRGEINTLIQVFDNIIINSIQAYEGKRGIIILRIYRREDNIIFELRDNAGGIKPEIKDKLFKEMTTTKGKNGTGLGLYMSYSLIKGRFNGDI
ncbi:MAG: histidine kinase N-terminal 7TM domain-containing protein, partial [Eubacteriales bacterium]|nr:histidine kinase N-terminal 7TM domain-containing protein [Eubacteriales bacterium]